MGSDTRDTVKRRLNTLCAGSYTYGVKTATTNTVKTYPTSHIGFEETQSHRNDLWINAGRIYRNPNVRKSDRDRLKRILDMQDLGWGFRNQKNYYSDNGATVSSVVGKSVQYVWNGRFYAHRANSLPQDAYWPQLGPVDWLTVIANGATAIKRCEPLKPAANTAQFIGELREELPSIPLMALQDRAGYFRSLGSEYLNVEFGWLPFISDLQKTFAALRNRNAIIGQLLRDSDRAVRRRYSFPSVRESKVTTLAAALPQPASPFPSNYPNTPYAKTLTEVTGRNDWFSGKFLYHIPGKESLLSDLERYDAIASKLLGTRVTPAVLWELTPWSWLADWFGNFGDVINNFASFGQDNLVMPYGYSMSTVYKENIYNLAGSPSGPLEQKFGSVHKLRLRASPYGFGIDWPDFSAYQLSILAALGLSRR